MPWFSELQVAIWETRVNLAKDNGVGLHTVCINRRSHRIIFRMLSERIYLGIANIASYCSQ